MRRYLWPGLLILLSLVGPPACDILMSPDGFHYESLAVVLAGYALGAIWWAIAASTDRGPLWRRLVLIWLPALPPFALLAAGVYATLQEDNAAMIAVLFVPPALIVGAACAIATGGVLLAEGDRSPSSET